VYICLLYMYRLAWACTPRQNIQKARKDPGEGSWRPQGLPVGIRGRAREQLQHKSWHFIHGIVIKQHALD
jgi:hypothetical protein